MSEFEDQELSQNTAQKKRKERVQKLQAQDIDATLWTMSSKLGRRFVYRLFKSTNFEGLMFYATERETCFRLGRRSLGIEIFNELQNLCPVMYQTMIAENTETDKEKQDESRTSND